MLQVTSLPPFSSGSQPHKSWFQNPIFVSQAPNDCQTCCWFLCFFFQGVGRGVCSPDLGIFIFVYFFPPSLRHNGEIKSYTFLSPISLYPSDRILSLLPRAKKWQMPEEGKELIKCWLTSLYFTLHSGCNCLNGYFSVIFLVVGFFLWLFSMTTLACHNLLHQE